MDLRDIFIIFFSYSVIGYIAEIFYLHILSKIRHIEYTHPTFGKLPFSPPYGMGVILCMWYIQTYPNNDIFVTASFCAITFSVIEYYSAIFCERFFHKKFWDYSDLPFNFQGRICLLNMTLFVISGLFFIQFLYTPTVEVLSGLSDYIKNITTSVLMFIFVGYILESENTRFLTDEIRKRISH